LSSEVKNGSLTHVLVYFRAFTAPDPILQALRNEAKVDKVLVGGDRTEDSMEKKGLANFLNQPETGGALKAFCIFTSKGQQSSKHTCSISRYSKQPSTRTDDINKAYFLGGGENPARKQKVERELTDAQQKIEDFKGRLRGMADEFENAVRLHNEAKARYEATKAKAEVIKKVVQKVDRLRSKVASMEEQANTDNSTEKRKLLKQVMNRMKSAITAIEAHSAGHSQFMEATITTSGIRINDSLIQTEYRRVR
jgi:DNA-binding PadR family transcriptional regulator